MLAQHTTQEEDYQDQWDAVDTSIEVAQELHQQMEQLAQGPSGRPATIAAVHSAAGAPGRPSFATAQEQLLLHVADLEDSITSALPDQRQAERSTHVLRGRQQHTDRYHPYSRPSKLKQSLAHMAPDIVFADCNEAMPDSRMQQQQQQQARSRPALAYSSLLQEAEASPVQSEKTHLMTAPLGGQMGASAVDVAAFARQQADGMPLSISHGPSIRAVWGSPVAVRQAFSLQEEAQQQAVLPSSDLDIDMGGLGQLQWARAVDVLLHLSVKKLQKEASYAAGTGSESLPNAVLQQHEAGETELLLAVRTHDATVDL